MEFDIIGDIHGHAERLLQILIKLGYEYTNCSYKHPHPDRKAIFVGDFIDRGPDIRKTLSIVKSMVDNDTAYAVLGNHEYNALCFHTLKDGHEEIWLRTRSDKNIKQHLETLYQFKDHKKEWENYLSWFMTLPLYLDLGDIRIIHAAWVPSEIDRITKNTERTVKLTKTLLQQSAIKGSKEFNTIELLLKGVELPLPVQVRTFKDEDGHMRSQIRIQWWESAKGRTYDEIRFPRDGENSLGGLQIQPTDAEALPLYEDSVPVFFGHYWLDPESSNHPQVQSKHICCLDYSVAKGGKLTAYRWRGEKQLTNDGFVWV